MTAVLVPDDERAYTAAMSLKSSAFLALVATLLLTVMLAVSLVLDLLGVVRGLVPAMELLTSLIRAFAALSMAVFFYIFHKAQS